MGAKDGSDDVAHKDGCGVPASCVPRPCRFWYLAHLFFGVLSGVLCYAMWRNRNRSAAKMHLIHSIWLPIPAFIPAAVIAAVLSV